MENSRRASIKEKESKAGGSESLKESLKQSQVKTNRHPY